MSEPLTDEQKKEQIEMMANAFEVVWKRFWDDRFAKLKVSLWMAFKNLSFKFFWVSIRIAIWSVVALVAHMIVKPDDWKWLAKMIVEINN